MGKNKKVFASSPERYTFITSTESGEKNTEIQKYYKTVKKQAAKQIKTDAWQYNNMESDLRSTKWIIDKVKVSDVYAQNLYAAMCNMQFLKLELMLILKDERWSASWRHSGGIIADMRGEGDYIDWYCSGSGGVNRNGPDSEVTKKYVSEGIVTDEVRDDLKELGWIPVPWDD